MSTTTEPTEFRFDGLKWLLVLAGIAGAVYGNYKLGNSEIGLLYHVLAMVGAGIVVAFIALNTAKGHAFWNLVKSAQIEVKKVVWPSPQEVNQTTLLVLLVVFVAAIILWGLDSSLGWAASKIIG